MPVRRFPGPSPPAPGDVLKVTSTIIEIIPSRSKPDRGIVILECITSNQQEQVLQRMVTKVLCFRKEG